VLLTTQYLDEADHLASQVVIIDHGRAVATGTPTELKLQIGGSVVEVHPRDARDLPRVANLLGDLDHGVVEVDEATRRTSVRVDSGGAELMDAIQSVNTAGIEVEAIGLRQPNLDEVFLALTGRPAEDDNNTAANAA
jgi:ABC-type multidrug transport system ATPase subunit